MTDLIQKTSSLLLRDPLRMACLRAAREAALPDWFIGAGFLRNAIWDHLHQKPVMTPLNDVDLVYFDPEVVSNRNELEAERQLSCSCPDVKWEVKNQARMHTRHGDQPYQNTSDGISRWMEVPTCVGVRLNDDDTLVFTAPYGLEENWSLTVRINPRFPRPELYRQRIEEKHWRRTWPKLNCIL